MWTFLDCVVDVADWDLVLYFVVEDGLERAYHLVSADQLRVNDVERNALLEGLGGNVQRHLRCQRG